MTGRICCLCGSGDVPAGKLAHDGCTADELADLYADEADWTGWLTPAERAAFEGESRQSDLDAEASYAEHSAGAAAVAAPGGDIPF